MTLVLVQAYLNSALKVINNSRCTCGLITAKTMANSVHFELFQCCRLVILHIFLTVTPNK